MEAPDADDVIDTAYPYDGPHDDEMVASAAAALPRLVRYLNNATGPGHRKASLTYAATAYRIVNELGAAIDLLPQVLEQVMAFLQEQADDPTLYDDRYDRPAADTAIEAALWMDTALVHSRMLASALAAVARRAGHLGNNDPKD